MSAHPVPQGHHTAHPIALAHAVSQFYYEINSYLCSQKKRKGAISSQEMRPNAGLGLLSETPAPGTATI